MPFSSADPNAFLAIGIQSALGAPQVTPAKLRFAKYLAGNTFNIDMQTVQLREGGDGLDYGFEYKKLQRVTGQLVVNARPEIIGQILQAVPGGATWDGASGPANHTFHTGHASFPWSTILTQHPGSSIIQLLSDVRFSGLTIAALSGEPWQLTLPFTAISHGASAAAAAPTYYGDDPWVFHQSPTYVIDGAAETHITGFTLTHQFGTDELQSQNVVLDDIPVMNRDTNISITRRYESAAQWQKIYYGGGVAPTTAVASGSFHAGVAYGAAAGLRQVDLWLPQLFYDGDALTELDPDGKTVIETITGHAVKSATVAMFLTVKNAHASAYAP